MLPHAARGRLAFVSIGKFLIEGSFLSRYYRRLRETNLAVTMIWYAARQINYCTVDEVFVYVYPYSQPAPPGLPV